MSLLIFREDEIRDMGYLQFDLTVLYSLSIQGPPSLVFGDGRLPHPKQI